MLRSLLIALLVMVNLTVHAQKDYVLSLQGDTLRGLLKSYSYDNIDRLQVISKDNKKTNFSALQVRGFVKEGIAYETVKFENSIRFMQVIKSGYLSLYAFNLTNQSLWEGRYLLKKDGSGMELPNLSFKKLVSKFLEDCHDVSSKIDEGKLRKSDIERIVDAYNACIQSKTVQVMKSVAHAAGTNKFKDEKIEGIKKLREKVEVENFLTKKDVIDLLNDMQNKLSRDEAVPNYLTDGLKSYLTDTPALSKEAEELIALLKK